MAMARCRECGGEVSSEAVVCPHCGIRDPAVAVAPGATRQAHTDHAVPPPHVRRRGGRAGWMVALLLLLVLAALFGLWYGDIVNFN